MFLQLLLFLEGTFFSPAALPAVPPVPNEIVEQPSLNPEAGTDTDGEVVEVHTILVLVGDEKA